MGGILGIAYVTNIIIDQVYLSSNVTVVLTTSTCNLGGFFGHLCFQNQFASFLLNNSYSKATVTPSGSNNVGGFFGNIDLTAGNISMIVANTYGSFTLGNDVYSFSISGRIGNGGFNNTNNQTFSFSNVFYNNVSSPFPPFNSNQLGRTSDGSCPVALNCSSLWNTVVNSGKFDQNSIWNGDKLRIEYYGGFGACSCGSGCVCPTIAPTSQDPTTQIYSTAVPTTQRSTTHLPTNYLSTTQVASTEVPTTLVLASKAPTTQLSSTFPTIKAAITQVPTISSPLCAVNVPNCQYCSRLAPPYNPSASNISCALSGGNWTWIVVSLTGIVVNNHSLVFADTSFSIQANFSNSAPLTLSGGSVALFNGSFNNTAPLLLNDTSVTQVSGDFASSDLLNISTSASLVVQGNFSATTSAIISFSVSANSSATIKVAGSVQLQGTVQLNLNAQPSNSSFTLIIFSFGFGAKRSPTPVPLNISQSQIQVIPNYNGSDCDIITSQINNQVGSLGVTIITAFGRNCSSAKNLGLIVGLSVGIPCIVTLLLIIILAYVAKREKKSAEKFAREFEMNRVTRN